MHSSIVKISRLNYIKYKGINSSRELNSARTLTTHHKEKANMPNVIPIWIFWNSIDVTKLVNLCLVRLKQVMNLKSRFTYKLHVLNDTNLHDYIPKWELHGCMQNEEMQALKSDLVRFALLKKYGGIYLDATVYVNENFDWIYKNDDYSNFVACFQPRNMIFGDDVPVIETSFLACPPNHPLITIWYEECLKIPNTCDRNAISIFSQSLVVQNHLDSVYHVVYNILSTILKKTPLNSFSNVILYDERDLGLMAFLKADLYDLTNPNAQIQRGILTKFCGWERKHIDSLPSESIPDRKSVV